MAGSTLASRALGRLLAQHRRRAGLTVYAAARAVETSQQTLARIEAGLKSKVTHMWIDALATAYEVSPDERQVLLGLAQELASVQKNWWRAYADEMKPHFDHYVSLEEAARGIAVWRMAVMPGMLQTPAYRRAVAWTEHPGMPTAQVEKRVELAVRRQERLKDPHFRMNVVLSECVFRDQIGGPGVMADQLRHLTVVSQLPNVSVRAVPFTAAGHLGSVVGSFVLLEFPEQSPAVAVEPPVAFIEGYAGDLYLEGDAEVKRYRDAFNEITRVALDQDTTRQLALSTAEEYGT